MHRNWDLRSLGYWASTAIVAFTMFGGGAAYLLRQEAAVAGVTGLGYPLYVLGILGVWKLLAGIVILVPHFPRLKEWAYAGMVFNLTGAFASHVASGSTADHLVTTASLTLLILVSWALRPQSRVLGEIFPAQMPEDDALRGNHARSQPQPAR